MSGAIRSLCAISVLCGLALLLAPEGGVKRLVSVCGCAMMLLAVISPLRDFDYASYALELARYRELGSSLASDAEDLSRRMNKALITRELEEYIASQAASLGVTELRAEAFLRWSTEGFWVPERVRLTGVFTDEQQRRLGERIAADLGISEEEQEWILLEPE